MSNIYSDDSVASDDSDYNENENILLSKVKRKRKDSESEDEAMFDVASDDDRESGGEIALSDVDDGNDNEDDLPNVKAWGKDKRSYYSTDYVDQDYGGHSSKDALNADFEEEAAQNLQLQLAKQLEDEDFFIDSIKKKHAATKVEVSVEDVQIVKTDPSNLTTRQQKQLLEKESPEFFNLVADFKEKISLVKQVFIPAKELYDKGQIPLSEALKFVLIYKDLLLNYCTNITMYLLLKSQRIKLQSHPIIKRLLQYRQFINQMDHVYEKYVAQKLADIINNDNEKVINNFNRVAAEKQKQKKCRKHININVSIIDSKKTVENNVLTAFQKQIQRSDFKEAVEDEEKSENELDEKRAITYQMKKNKGLMPTRKKEQRNPRVKHRNKFRKAQIRRKGAVREARTETNRYGGEISGIKASVTKSIKIK